MVRFVCSQCGKCCNSLGSAITIERAFDDRRFYCKVQVTGEHFVATVPGEYAALFGDPEKGEPGVCPFLRKALKGGPFLCTIYPTRPALCREFRCSQAEILDAEGQQIGKLGGRRSLLSRDPALTAIWEKVVLPLRENDDLRWRARMKTLLEREGYQVILYE